MVKKAVEVKGIRKIVRAFLKKYDPEWHDLGFAFQWMLEDNHLAQMWVYLEGDRVIDFLTTHYVDDQIILCPYFIDYDKIGSEVKSIADTFGKVIIEADYLEAEKFDLFECSLKSTIDETREYYMSGCGAFYTNTEELVNFFVKYYERIYFPEMNDISEISYQVMTSEELADYERTEFLGRTQYPIWKERFGHYTLIGFHYFKIENFDNIKYLLAIYKDKVVGVIKFGKYGKGKDVRQSICYIDVNKAYRKRGIASNMIKELGKYLEPELPLMVTDESELGSLCRMTEHFKNAGYDVPVYSFKEFYERRAV